jgi:hypothetical protein
MKKFPQWRSEPTRSCGRDAILSFFGGMGARSGGNLKVTVQEIIGGKNHTVALPHNHAENNGKTLDMDGARRPAKRNSPETPACGQHAARKLAYRFPGPAPSGRGVALPGGRSLAKNRLRV